MAAEPAFIAQLSGDSDVPEASTEEGTGESAASAAQSNEPSVTEPVGERDAQGSDPKLSVSETPAAAKAPDQVANLHVALRESRAELKELRAELSQLKALIPPPKAQEAPAVEEPDFLSDPKSYVDGVKGAIAKLEAKIADKDKAQTEQAEQQQKAQETWGKVLESEATFVASTPDYHDALAHVRSVRAQQLQMMHPEATQQQIAQHIQGEEFQGAAALVAQGKNPSEFYYNYAKTFGYKPKAAPAPATNQQQRPDKDAVRTMGSGGASESVGNDEPVGALGILAQAQNEHKAQFKRRK